MSSLLKACGNCKREFFGDEDFLKHTSRWRQCSEGNLWVNCACGSTLLLPRGKYDWFAPEKQMSTEAVSVFNKLSVDKNIPHLDTQVLKIQEILSKEEFKLGELSDAIKFDPLIASNVLSVANNLKVQGVNQIDSIKHAIVYIGKETLREIVLIAGIKRIEIKTTTFILEDYWEEAINAGRIAESVSQKFAPHLIPDEVYIGACLANIGKLLTAMIYPDTADKIIEGMYGEEIPLNWFKVETKLKTARHTILGEIAAVLWGLPSYVADIASFHHNTEALFLNNDGQKKLTKLDVVALSIQIGHLMQVEPEVVQNDVIDKFLKSQKLSRKGFDSFVMTVKNKLRKSKVAS